MAAASLAAVAAGSLLISSAEDPSWNRLLPGAGALACCSLMLLSDVLAPRRGCSVPAWVTVQRQSLFFIALLLASFGSHAGATDCVLRLATAALAWHVLPQVPASVRWLALLVQMAQTAIVCCLYLRSPEAAKGHVAGGGALFCACAGLVGILTPAVAILCNDTSSAVLEAPGSESAGAVGALSATRTDGSTAAGGSSQAERSSPSAACANPDVSTVAAPAHAAASTPPIASLPPTLPAPSAMCASTQTDDELLLWLLAGTSHTPSMADDGTSVSNSTSPFSLAATNAVCLAVEGDYARGGAATGLDSVSCEAGGSGGRISRRVDAVTKRHDSFTSVWSRGGTPAAPRPHGRASLGDGDAEDRAQRLSLSVSEDASWPGSVSATSGSDLHGAVHHQRYAGGSGAAAAGRARPWRGTAVPGRAGDGRTRSGSGSGVRAPPLQQPRGEGAAAARDGAAHHHHGRGAHAFGPVPAADQAGVRPRGPARTRTFSELSLQRRRASLEVVSTARGAGRGPGAVAPLESSWGSWQEADSSDAAHQSNSEAPGQRRPALAAPLDRLGVARRASAEDGSWQQHLGAHALDSASTIDPAGRGRQPARRAWSWPCLLPALESGRTGMEGALQGPGATHLFTRSAPAPPSATGSGGVLTDGSLWPRHQAHRRACLVRAWLSLLAEAGMPSTPEQHPDALRGHVTDWAPPDRALHADPSPHAAADAPAARSSGAPGEAGEAEGSAPAGEPRGAHLQRPRHGTHVGAEAADERSARLSKSLSERSLLRAAGVHRRVSRSKSRFALLQEPDAADGGGRHTSGVPRTSSAGTLGGPWPLEGVLEEREAEEALAAAAAGHAEGSAGGAAAAAGAAGAEAGAGDRLRLSEADSSRSAAGADAGADGGGDPAHAASAALTAQRDAGAAAAQPAQEGPAAASAAAAPDARAPRAAEGLALLTDAALAAAAAASERWSLPLGAPLPRTSSGGGGGGGGGGSTGGKRRAAWRSASELSLAGSLTLGARRARFSDSPPASGAHSPASAVGRVSTSSSTSSVPRAAALRAADDSGIGFPPSLASLVGGVTEGGAPRSRTTSGAGQPPAGAGAAEPLPRPSLAGRESSSHSHSHSHSHGDSVSGGAAALRSSSSKTGHDSDEDLLEVFGLQVPPAATRGKSRRDRLGHIAEHARPAKASSFRFAAPLVPPTLPAAAAAAADAAPVGAAAAGQPADSAPPTSGSPATSGSSRLLASSGDGVAAPTAPPVSDPVLPEQRHRPRTPSSGSAPSAGAAAAAASAGDAGAAAASALAAAATAALSATNLAAHTEHWEASGAGARDPAEVLLLLLGSPSPSQSGPIDPLQQSGDVDAAAAAAAAAIMASPSEPGGASSGARSSGSHAAAAAAVHALAAAPGGGAAAASVVHFARRTSPPPPGAAPPPPPQRPARTLHRQISATTTVTTVTTAGGVSLGGDSGTSVGEATEDGASAIVRVQSSLHTHSASAAAVIAAAAANRSLAGGRGSSGGAGRSAAPLQPSNRGRSNLGGPASAGGGGVLSAESPEMEIETAVIANRRAQDDRGILLEEVVIDKVLGFGSMGMVYHGRLYDTRVVVKLIEHGTGVLGKEKERGRLARVEATVSRLLLHPNIVTTYDACTGALQPGRLAARLGRGRGGAGGGGGRGGRQRCMTVMVQELCELGTLKDALSKRKLGLGASAESLPVLLRVALDVANGMKHLAALKVIHADLKAENVLLARTDASPDRPHGFTAKVADFGLAMVLAPGEDEVRQGIHGTVSHMPPEAMRDTVFSLATDVFSFGVVLWELYTGESPYRGMAPHEVVEAVVRAGQRPVWPPGSPPDLAALAADCWHSEPHQRPSFADVVERLRRLLAPAHPALERSASMVSYMTEDSDELEAALRQQRRTGPAPTVRAVRASGVLGAAAGGGGSPSDGDAGSDLAQQALAAAGASASGAPAGYASGPSPSVHEGADGAAPRDPLGLLLWVLCQEVSAEAPQRVAGPSPDSEQWVLQVQDLVLASRAREEAARAAELAARASSSRDGPVPGGWVASRSSAGGPV